MTEKRRSHTTGEDGSEVKRSKDNEGWLEISPQNLLSMGNLRSRPVDINDFDDNLVEGFYENISPTFSNREKSSCPARVYNGAAVEGQYAERFSGFHSGIVDLDYDYAGWRNDYIFSDQEEKKSARTSQQNEPPDNDDPESCCICMEVLDKEVHRGQPDSCEHIFCLCCIKAWSEKTNLCPLCKTEFNSILIDDGSVEEKVTSRKLRPEDFDEGDYNEDVDDEDEDEPLDDYEPDDDDLDEIGWPLSTHIFDSQEDSDNSESESRGFRKCPLCDLFVRYDEITICIVCLGAGHRACGYQCGPGEESCNRCGMPLDDGTPIIHVNHLPHYLRHLDESSLVGRLASAVEMVGNPRRIGWPSGNNGTTVPRSVRSMRTLTLRRQQNAQASRIRENARETDPVAPSAPRPRRQRGRRPRNTHDLSPTAGNAPRTVSLSTAPQPLGGTHRPRQNNRTTSNTRGTARGTARGNRGGLNRSAEPSQTEPSQSLVTQERSSGRGQRPSGRGQRPSGRGQSPSGRGQSPSGRGQSPSGRGQSPSARGQRPSGRGQRPSGRGQSPSARGQRPSGRGQRGGQQILPTVELNREEETTSTSAATNSDMGYRTRSVNTAAPRIPSR